MNAIGLIRYDNPNFPSVKMALSARQLVLSSDQFAKSNFCKPLVQPQLRPAYSIARAKPQDAPIELSPIITFQEVQDIAQSRYTTAFQFPRLLPQLTPFI